ncbi:metallophosphoesterase [Heliobacterium undosum]|uniref:Metallophosphoesterase n=1 Tax=Heliomicrobium undosum TaxID=121734 RepID=A0A845L2G3_9FIRM|nr:metallophosphoesterase [Heliomicrobium undosum]MZP29195.1 metallophosphoesterase [Heliomicrobium undosum]
MAIIFALYGLLHYWIGLRGWQAFGHWVPAGQGWTYWATLVLLAAAYPLGRITEGKLPALLTEAMIRLGAYWLGALIYIVLLLGAVEAVLGLNRLLHFLPQHWLAAPQAAARAGMVAVALIAAIVAYGAWNARNPEVVRYEATIAKDAGEMKELKVAVVSDLHLGLLVHNGRLTRMVELVQAMEPDLVLLPGDVIDEDPGAFSEQEMQKTFGRLKPPLGIYAVPGNHEYIGGKWEEIFTHLEASGVRVLRDETVTVGGAVTIVGRDDLSRGRFTGEPRKELDELMARVNRAQPVLLMDHQPFHLEEAENQGVDVQLSGHTHRGQLFPGSLITGRLYENDWGLSTRGAMTAVVSSGFGTWGPPIRVGSRAEVVELKIRFTGPAGGGALPLSADKQ